MTKFFSATAAAQGTLAVMVRHKFNKQMTYTKTIFFLTLLTLTLTSFGQTKHNRNILGKTNAESELKTALNDKTQHNYIDNKRIIIKDSLTAVNVAEPILFSIYGLDNIKSQRPYEIYFIDNYWVISGTLPKDYVGGTFLIIIDGRDSKIIKITHGK